MKRLAAIALSAISLGGSLYLLIATNKKIGDKKSFLHKDPGSREEVGKTETHTPTKAPGASEKNNGPLGISYGDRNKSSKRKALAKVTHLRKDGSPDKRFKENRTRE